MRRLLPLAILLTTASGCWPPGASVRTDSFKSDQERVNFINRFSPAIVPNGATHIRVECAEWQGISFSTSFDLPPQEFGAFVAEVEKLAKSSEPTIVNGRQAVLYELAPKAGLEHDLGREVDTKIWIIRGDRSAAIGVDTGEALEDRRANH